MKYYALTSKRPRPVVPEDEDTLAREQAWAELLRLLKRKAPGEDLNSVVSDLEGRIKLRSVGWEVSAADAHGAAREADAAAQVADLDAIRFVQSTTRAILCVYEMLVTSEGEGLRTVARPLVHEPDHHVQSVADAVQSEASLFSDPMTSVTGTDIVRAGDPLAVKLASVTVVVAV